MRLAERHGLWVVLGLALLLRLSPMLFEHQVGQDIAEFENIAQNLRAGGGFTMDIEAYWAWPKPRAGATRVAGYQVFPPTRHYAFYERPILLPALLAGLRTGLPPLAASQAIGPLLFLLTLALIYQTVRWMVGPGAAFSVGLLLALQPALFELSLKPLSENTVLLALALIAWSHFRMRSAVLTGIACSLAFLARPSMLLFAMILGLIYLADSIRNREPMRVVSFAFCALVGPVWVMILNLKMRAPATTLPVSFLFNIRDFTHGMFVFHEGRLYASGLELIRENQHEVARRIALNGWYYAKALVSTQGLGMLLALVPIAAAGLSQAHSRPLRQFRLLALFALADLGLYTITWSTFDAGRFLAVTYLVGVVLIVLGTHEVFDREPLFRLRGAWRSAAAWAALMVALVWGAMDAGNAYLAWREWQLGRPLSNNLEQSWTAPGAAELTARLNQVRGGESDPQKLPVVASNDPWLVQRGTGFPAGKIPSDLRGAEWLDLLRAMKADLVVIHEGEWPAEYVKNMKEFEAALRQAGWKEWFAKGQVRSWTRPIKAGKDAHELPRAD